MEAVELSLEDLINKYNLTYSNPNSRQNKKIYISKCIEQKEVMQNSQGGMNYEYFYRRMSLNECKRWISVYETIKAGDYSLLETMACYCNNTGLMWAGNYNYCSKIEMKHKDEERTVIMEVKAKKFTEKLNKYGFSCRKSEDGTFSFSFGTKSSNSFNGSHTNDIKNDFDQYFNSNKILSCFSTKSIQDKAKALLLPVFF